MCVMNTNIGVMNTNYSKSDNSLLSYRDLTVLTCEYRDFGEMHWLLAVIQLFGKVLTVTGHILINA